MWVPAKTEAFLLMADQLDLRVWRARGRQAVLGPVKDQDLSVDGKRRDDVGVLRLVARLVDLARVVDLLCDVELDDGRLPRRCLAAIAANLATLLDTVRIPERSLVGNMNWATFLFRDVVQERLDGGNPFGNIGVKYSGSRDDVALNAGVLRYPAEPAAVRKLAADSDPTGRVNIPTLGLHAIDDPTAFVELESVYRDVRVRAGTADLLVQTFSRESEHSYLSDAEYPTLFAALLDWIDNGRKPTAEGIAARCKDFEARFGDGCHFDPTYVPQPLTARVPPRERT